MVATIADLGLNFVGIWVLTYLVKDIDIDRNIGASAFFVALLISVAEIFFHIYMKKVVLHEDDH